MPIEAHGWASDVLERRSHITSVIVKSDGSLVGMSQAEVMTNLSRQGTDIATPVVIVKAAIINNESITFPVRCSIDI